MSTRERWIVYPLLFLTLGTVMRDKFVPQTSLGVESLQCNRLNVQKVIHCDELHARKVDCREMSTNGLKGWLDLYRLVPQMKEQTSDPTRPELEAP